MRLFFLFLFLSYNLNSQNLNVNNDFFYETLRYSILDNTLETNFSFNIKPINSEYLNSDFNFNSIYESKNGKIKIKSLGLDYFTEFNSSRPYNRNNGTMIPNRGYQHILSPGIYLKLGPLSISFKPEHHYSENKKFDGFWEGHYDEIWVKRYRLWNKIDIPERFGTTRHNQTTFGQSNIKLNWKFLSIGISSENIWWGPSFRNGIMMSNHAQGFKHLTFNTNKPLTTFIGDFEWQIISGRLESSGYTPPRTNFVYAGTKVYIPKINQRGELNDWRYLQGYIFSYSPKWIKGLSFGIIRWVQMYSSLVEGKYYWIDGNTTYFPAFQNFFRKNDKYEDYEQQTDQAAGIFFKWLWLDSKSEFYFELHHNDSKNNFRDLFLDTDHSRAFTMGLQKIFLIGQNKILFGWEWTQMEQTAGRLLRDAGSWYEHTYVVDGYTNKGEVIGSSIGPGSNSNYIFLNYIKKNQKIGLSIEIVEHDNDFYYEAFDSANDYRRYWKDINIGIKFNKRLDNFIISSNLILIRSLNYQWELNDNETPYYHSGKDLNNLSFSFKLTYLPGF